MTQKPQRKRPSDKDRPPKISSIKRSAKIEDEAKPKFMIDLRKIYFPQSFLMHILCMASIHYSDGFAVKSISKIPFVGISHVIAFPTG